MAIALGERGAEKGDTSDSLTAQSRLKSLPYRKPGNEAFFSKETRTRDFTSAQGERQKRGVSLQGVIITAPVLAKVKYRLRL